MRLGAILLLALLPGAAGADQPGGCDPIPPCRDGVSRLGEDCGDHLMTGCPDIPATCTCEVDLICSEGGCRENPAWYTWEPGTGARVFDAAALRRARKDVTDAEQGLEWITDSVRKTFRRLDTPNAEAVLRPYKARLAQAQRRADHLIGLFAPGSPVPATLFRRLGIATRSGGAPEAKSLEAFLRRQVKAGVLSEADAAELRQVLAERRGRITNPADAGQHQIAEATAQTLWWFGFSPETAPWLKQPRP